jgi:hypothetical protein
MSRACGAMMAVLIGAATTASEPDKVGTATFTRDVAPILQKSCTSCHRPGEIGPMPLTSYSEARPWAKAIREAVAGRKMPPWHAAADSRPCENDSRLSQREIDTVLAWVDGGAKEGDPGDMPPTPAFVEGWSIGKPDLVFSMREEFTIPAEGVIPFTYFAVPTNLEQDTWVQAAEVRPGNRAVVHHAVVLVREPRSNTEGADPNQNLERRLERMLVGTAPGMPAAVFKPGQGKLIRPGSILIFQVHYTPNGSIQKDRTSVGLILAKAPVEQVVVSYAIGNDRFRIPAGDPNYEVRSSFTFPEDARVLSAMPHMHMRGKDFSYTAVYPDGRRELLLNVPRWDFNWQQVYRFKEPVFMPKGSRIDCLAHFDNSPGNKSNPDPTKDVPWGDQVWEEMMIGWMDFVFEKPRGAP